MEVGKQDLIYIENAIKTFKKGTFSLEGVEVLAFAETVIWLSRVVQAIQLEEQQKAWAARQREQEAQVMAATMPKQESFQLEEPQVEEQPDSPPKASRKRKSK